MLIKINRNNSHIATLTLVLSVIYLQISTIPISKEILLYAQNSQFSSHQIDKAEENYFNSNFEEAIKIINECLNDPLLSKTDQVRAYTILARISLVKNDLDITKKFIRNILKIEPNYQPTIEQETPKYVNLVAEVKKEELPLPTKESKTSRKKWLYIGAGGVSAAVIIILLTHKKNDDEKGNGENNHSLPEPPNFP